MATVDVQLPAAAATVFGSVGEASNISPHDIDTVLNYFKPNEDGSPPHPTYVGRPETYERPFATHPVRIQDLNGREDQFTLDKNGFQIYKHTSIEKAFENEQQIKDSYYKETEQLLKDA